MKQFLIGLAKIIYYSIVVVMVVVAILVSILHLLAPKLNIHALYFENLAQKIIGTKVTIGKAKASWDGLLPQIDFFNVTIYRPQGVGRGRQKVLVNIKHCHAVISLWKLLLALKFQPSVVTNMVIDGVNVNIVSLPHDQYKINGLLVSGLSQVQTDNTKHKQWLGWLQKQPHIALNAVNIHWQCGKDHCSDKNRPYVVNINHLDVVNNANTHQLGATVTVAQIAVTKANIKLKAQGDLTDIKHLQVLLYADVGKVNLSQWWQKPWGHYLLRQGNISAKLWLSWANNHWQQVQTQLTLDNLQIQSLTNHKLIAIDHCYGHLAWQRLFDGWLLLGDRLSLALHHHQWPTTSFSLQQHNGRHTQLLNQSLSNQANNTSLWQRLMIGYVNLSDLVVLLRDADVLPVALKKLSDQSKLSGQATNIVINHHGTLTTFTHRDDMTMDLHHVAMLAHDNIPGVANLSGRLQLSPHHNSLVIKSHHLVISQPQWFAHSINVGDVVARLTWQQLSKGDWLIKGCDIAAVNKNAAVFAKLSLLIPPSPKSPVISLLLGLYQNNPYQIKQYFPSRYLHHIHPKLANWLAHAIVAGNSATATLVLQGPLKSFPYQYNRGTFLLDATLDHFQLCYAKHWPVIDKLNGKLIFSGNTMSALVSYAKLYHTTLDNVNVSIPALVNPQEVMVNISGFAHGDASDILRFIKKSPLNKTVGHDVSVLTISGNTKTRLALTIPLKHLKQTMVKGSCEFYRANVALKKWPLNFHRVTGVLQFTKKQLSAKNIKANLFHYPVNASLTTQYDKDNNRITQIALASHLNVDILRHYFHLPYYVKARGSSAYKAVVALYANSLKQHQLIVNSNLQGTSVNAPPPFCKTKTQIVPLQFTLRFGHNKPEEMLVKYGQLLSARGLFETALNRLQWQNLHLHLGRGSAQIDNQPGVIITGSLAKFDWPVWRTYLKQFKQASNTTLLSLHLIDVTLGQFNVYGQRLNQAHVKMIVNPNDYNVDIASDKIKGQFTWPKQFPKRGVLTGHFERLYLQSMPALRWNKKPSSFNPRGIPAINIKADDMQYSHYRFSDVVLNLAPYDNGLIIHSLAFHSGLLTGLVQGKWQRLPNHHDQTVLSGTLSTQAFEQLLKKLKFHSSLTAHMAHINFQLTWPFAPYQFRLTKASGSASIDLGSGRIVDLGLSANNKLNFGRLLTLLSMHNLFTGFSDMQHQGYNFDTMHSEIALNKGTLLLSRCDFNGTVARLAVQGVMDMITRKLHLHLQVIPHLTSSLPIVAGVATLNPVVGVATWVANKLITPAVNKITVSYYKVTGNFDHPLVQKLDQPLPPTLK